MVIHLLRGETRMGQAKSRFEPDPVPEDVLVRTLLDLGVMFGVAAGVLSVYLLHKVGLEMFVILFQPGVETEGRRDETLNLLGDVGFNL